MNLLVALAHRVSKHLLHRFGPGCLLRELTVQICDSVFTFQQIAAELLDTPFRFGDRISRLRRNPGFDVQVLLLRVVAVSCVVHLQRKESTDLERRKA